MKAVVCTQGILAHIPMAEVFKSLLYHAQEIDSGNRVHTTHLHEGKEYWIITEPDGTTVLLPEEN